MTQPERSARQTPPGQAIPARILVVDDEVAQMEALRDTLKDHGYETVGYTGSAAALAALRESKFDLLLTDLMMPEMGGIALLQAAREIDPDLIGIIMTGEGTIATAVEAMKVGAFDYILKPFRLSVVLPVLARARAMRRLRLENAQLHERLAERAAELEAANRELEAFSYSVSHDLRTPLKTIDSYTAQIEEQLGDKVDELGKRLIRIVRDSSKRMSVLIDDMLAFSRLGRQAIHAAKIDMAALANEAWSELRTASPERAPELKVQPMPAGWGDPALVKQVWTNLLSNALKYSGKTATPLIEISGEARNGETVYCVKDNGVGFDMQHYNKLFEVFQRLHSGHEFSGSGVGLAIVERVVDRHGGRVWARGQVNAGAAFYFSLPVAKGEGGGKT